MMKIKTILLLTLLITTSCNEKKSLDNSSKQNSELESHLDRPMNDTGIPISELKVLALEKGDTSAYNSLRIEYLEYPAGEFQHIALKMANKYNYPQAYFDFYNAILEYNGIIGPEESLENIDDKSRELAIRYLIMGAQKGHEQSIEILKEEYLNLNSENRKFVTTKKTLKDFHDFIKILDSNNIRQN